MATKKIENETNEAKETKSTTRKRATTKKTSTATSKSNSTNKAMTIEDIPQDLIAQLTAQIMANITNSNNYNKATIVENEEANKEPIKYTKAYFTTNADVRKEVVPVRSVVPRVTYASPKSKLKWKWLEKGFVEYLTIDELLTMDSASPRFLRTPWLVVDDERVVEAFGLKELYEIINRIEDIEDFVNHDTDYIKETIEKLPSNFKLVLASELNIKIRDGLISVDYYKVKVLEDLLQVKFDNE